MKDFSENIQHLYTENYFFIFCEPRFSGPTESGSATPEFSRSV